MRKRNSLIISSNIYSFPITKLPRIHKDVQIIILFQWLIYLGK